MTIFLIIYITGIFVTGLLWTHILMTRRDKITIGDIAFFIPIAFPSWLSVILIFLVEYCDVVIYKRKNNKDI